MEEALTRFLRSLEAHGYSTCALDATTPALVPLRAYLRHDVQPEDLGAGLRLAALHEKLRVPASFHLIWDLIENDAQMVEQAQRFGVFDPAYVQLGLQCDPISSWLLRTRFAASESRLAGFVDSREFVNYLDGMLTAWRAEGVDAPVLCAVRDGAWQRLVELDRSFRRAVGRSSSISGRGSPLSNAFFRACVARPEFAAIAAWFSPIDFLVSLDLGRLGYPFEATRFSADPGLGPAVMFGGVDIAWLRECFQTRLAGGGGFVAIFPAGYWDGDRYRDLLPDKPAQVARPPTRLPEAAPPDQPVLTRPADLAAFGPDCERLDAAQLAAAARRKVGLQVDADFPRFIEWLRGEGYSFGGFEQGMPRFGERWAYLRHDVHMQDLLAAYVLADLHQRLKVVGSFQITWNFSRYEEAASPYFVKLLEYDRRFVQFGLHAAPTATWYLNEKLAGDYTRQREATNSDEFLAWLWELHAAYLRDGDAASALREIRAGTDDALSRIAASFRATFGDWKSISGHGNFLTNGFVKACASHPQLSVLQPYFHPVVYMAKYGVDRFGFDFEITFFRGDDLPFPRIMMEGVAEETRRGWYRGRVGEGAGFVALFHPASWTCRHNASFFLPVAEAAQLASAALPPQVAEPTATRLDAAIARLREIVRDEWIAIGADPEGDPAVAANIEYNSGECRSRAATLLAFAERAYGFSMPGKSVAELGAGFAGLCLHWALEHGAERVLAVDQVSSHVAALQTVVRQFALSGVTALEADLQAFTGHDESVDLVVLSDVLHTANLSPARVAEVCARLLRPGGIVLFRNVNRAHGLEVASHHNGSQFLDPGSADRGALFFGRGSGSTLAHRPLSPSGLAAFLRRAGFAEFRLCGDDETAASGRTRANQGLQPRYRLGARKATEGPRPLHRLPPPRIRLPDRASFDQAVDRISGSLGSAVEHLRRLFGDSLTRDAVTAELRAYLIDRLLLDGTVSFRRDRGDQPARDFAAAVDHALDYALAAVLSRHAGWEPADFQQADPRAFAAVLAECTAAARRGFRQPAAGAWSADLDWEDLATRAVRIILPERDAERRFVDVVARRLRDLVADRLRLHEIELFRRTSDPVTGSVEAEYGEAAIDRIEGEVWDLAEPDAEGSPRPMHGAEMICLIEEIDAKLAAAAAATVARSRRSLGAWIKPQRDRSGSRGMPAGAQTSVCILSRKPLANITRVTRMGTALVAAGYRVSVVSLGAPVQQLRDMCPEIDYVEVAPQAVTARLIAALNRRLMRHRNRLARRQRRDAETLRRSGLPAALLRLHRLAVRPVGRWALQCWREVCAAPCAALLKKDGQKFAAAWRELAHQESLQSVALLLRALQQQASTRAFAKATDAAVRHRRFDVVQAHDNYALPAAARLAARDHARLIYDAVELTEHRLATNFGWLERLGERRQRRAEAAIFRHADLVTTVSEGLAEWYGRHHRIARPLVIRNCRYYWDYREDARLRADIAAGPEVRIVIWFGRIYPQQGIELLIDAVRFLPAHIHIAVVAWTLPMWTQYLAETLPQRAGALGVAGRVHFLPPREPNDLVPYASGADLGIIPRPSEHLNNFYSLPNKFMEMVMARLPIAVSRLGDIVELVRRCGIGAVFDESDAGDIARTIEGMLDIETHRRLKANVMRAAEEMTWENESRSYVAAVAALARPHSAGTPAPAIEGTAGRLPVCSIW
jgi:glycosyltransferase involved in cell wall biosynthesis/SAM-dependent methyltransferase